VSPETNGDGFFEGFLDDYFAEADDHLTAIRAALLALESGTHNTAGERTLLDDLFRRFHSLKGISGMVELREAELLAHHMESHVRGKRQGEARLSAHALGVLFDATSVLEQVVIARRRGQEIPSIAQPLAALASLEESASVAVEGAPGAATIRPADETRDLWRFTFTPSPELAGIGVNVNAIRARLGAVGEIVEAKPDVRGDGAILFTFVVRGGSDALAAVVAPHEGLIGEPVPSAEASVPPSSGTDAPVMPGDESAATVSPAHFIRVDLARLDDLMRIIGDLVISRARLDDTLAQAAPEIPQAHRRALQDNALALERQIRELREAVMRVRLVKVGEIFRRMPFVVRDLGRDLEKRVRLEMRGHTTEIDKFLVERLMDPMLHLVRNAVSHGIETPAERIAAGKPPDATLTLSATTVGEQVVIEVSDDGRGIDVDEVLSRGRAQGLAHEEGADVLSVLCAPGFSTRDRTDRASGRGIGMSVVKTTVEELGGTIELSTARGAGTTFTLHLPLTLAITDALVARVGDQTFAVPQASVREVLEVDPSAVRSLENNEVVAYRGGVLPLLRLSTVFALEPRPRRTWHALVIGSGLSAVGIVVDRIVGQREIVVRAISDPLIAVDGIAGATDLGDGRVVLILDATALSRHARTRVPLGRRGALAS
jgi:two-component system chemotaxis sensor kinase CheA